MDVRLPNGLVIQNVPDDITQAELASRLKAAGFSTEGMGVSEPAAVSVGRTLADIPRQVGLTARAGLSGALDVADLLASPIRGAMNLIPGVNIPRSADAVPDMLGLPQPQGANERTVQQAARSVAGAMLPIGIAKSITPTTGVGAALRESMIQTPGIQAATAAGAGGGMQAAQEAGAGALGQTAAALVGGLGGAGAIPAGQRVAQTGQRLAQRFTPPQGQQQAFGQIDIKIDQILQDSGMRMSDLPLSTQNILRDAARDALNTKGELSTAAIRRLADYGLTGATPTRATLSQDPVISTQQKNAAKMGANSTDPASQRLAMLENENNAKLLTRLDDLGAAQAPGAFELGDTLITRLANIGRAKQAEINGLYDIAKSSGGRNLELEPFTFTENVGKRLNAELKTKFLPAEIKGYLNDIAEGKLPLTVDVAEQLKTTLATAQRGAVDGNIRTALGIVRDELESAPLRVGQEIGRETIEAFNAARKATREFKVAQEKNPALKAAIEGTEPDKFFEQYIVRAPTSRLNELMGMLTPNDKLQIKAQVAEYLKMQATSSPDNIGRLSGIAMEKAMRRFGSARLAAVFSPEELQQLKAVSNVARYEQNQPVGSAVNNSNTASAFVGMINRLAQSSALGKIPLGSFLQQPAINISAGMGARQAFDTGSVLRQMAAPQPVTRLNPVTAGLLGMEE